MSVRVREAAAADVPGIRRLFERTFGRPLSEEEWRWKFDQNPDGWFGTVVEDAGEVVGHYAGSGTRARVGGEETLVYAVGDVATDPRIRGLGRHVFREMTDAFYDAVDGRGIPYCFGFPGARHLVISERFVGARVLFPIREARVPVDAFPPAPPGARTGDFVGADFDAFWMRIRERIPEGPVRDRTRVNWRFHARPARYYRMVWTADRTGAMTGWVVLSISGSRALVADHLFEPEGGAAYPAVLSAAAAEARRLGASELAFWETPGGPGHSVISALPGGRHDAGFSMIARPLDDAAVRRLESGGHVTPALYDMV
ncbi:MAG: GNAT family N-acetyltransferase [Acidobacteriota bacterium]